MSKAGSPGSKHEEDDMTIEAAVITTTVSSQEEAARLGSSLVDQRLAACVQEIAINSRYRWDDEVRCDPEILLVIKTAPDRVESTIEALESAHPYDVPEMLVLDVVAGARPYLDWLRAETRRPEIEE